MIDKRLMYAQGQRVKKNKDGSRPGYRGYGAAQDSGNAANSAASAAAGTSSSGSSSSGDGRPNIGQISGPATTSFTDADDNRQNYKTDQYTAPPANPDETTIDELTNTFVPIGPPKKSAWDGLKQVLGIAAFFSPHTVIGKIGQTVSTIDKAKQVSSLAKDLGITNTDVIGSITNNLSDNFTGFNNTTSKGPENAPTEGGDGDNPENALLSEYLLLLQRMEKGMLSAEEQGRFNNLKSRLGKADGGIMNVNMNRGRLGETLHG